MNGVGERMKWEGPKRSFFGQLESLMKRTYSDVMERSGWSFEKRHGIRQESCAIAKMTA